MSSEKLNVVLVHGIWMRGLELLPLRRRLGRCEFNTFTFSYRSLAAGAHQHGVRLAEFLKRKNITHSHFVGHSLGGLVIREFLQVHPDYSPCRVVALGTPFNGSRVASNLGRFPLSRWIIGKNVNSPLTAGVPDWPERHALGVIAGTRPVGMGRVVSRFDGPNDGTVAVSETRITGMRSHICYPTAHTGIVFSRPVADQVCNFLKTGQFAGQDQT